jgi:hypothetical protein
VPSGRGAGNRCGLDETACQWGKGSDGGFTTLGRVLTEEGGPPSCNGIAVERGLDAVTSGMLDLSQAIAY